MDTGTVLCPGVCAHGGEDHAVAQRRHYYVFEQSLAKGLYAEAY
jgi:hypothetical protein